MWGEGDGYCLCETHRCSCDHCESEGRATVRSDCLWAPAEAYALAHGASDDTAETFAEYAAERRASRDTCANGYYYATGYTWERFLADREWTRRIPDGEFMRLRTSPGQLALAV